MGMQKTSKRHLQRMRAFQVLYSLYFTPAPTILDLQERFRSLPEDQSPTAPAAPAAAAATGAAQGEDAAQAASLPAPSGFAWDLVRGVWNEQGELDAIIEDVAKRRIERIGRVEQVILRMGTFELRLPETHEPKIVLSEAVTLANEFGDDNCRQFINGILHGIAKRLHPEI